VALDITDGPRKGQAVTMRQVTRRQGNGHQVRVLTTRTGLSAAGVACRMFSRWRQENYFRYARLHFDLDSHDSCATTPDNPRRLVPNPAKKTACTAVGKARRAAGAAETARDAELLALRSPAPGQAITITNPMLAEINASPPTASCTCGSNHSPRPAAPGPWPPSASSSTPRSGAGFDFVAQDEIGAGLAGLGRRPQSVRVACYPRMCTYREQSGSRAQRTSAGGTKLGRSIPPPHIWA
jgi:hypothetical protein